MGASDTGVYVAPKLNAKFIFFLTDKGFGFLRVDGYPHDLFVHAREMKMAGIPNTVEAGTAIRCRVGTKDGRALAVDLEWDGA